MKDDEKEPYPDTIDPDSVDFEPLMTSFNGAAITPPLNDSIEDDLLSYDDENQLDDDDFDSSDSDHDEDDIDDDNRSKKNRMTNIQSMVIRKLRSLIVLLSNPSWISSPDQSLKGVVTICSAFFILMITYSFMNTQIDTSNLNNNVRGSSNDAETFMMSPNAVEISPQGIGLAPPVGTRIPTQLRDTLADVNDLPMELMDTAIYWHAPRSAGTTMQHVIATCLGKVVASEVGGLNGHFMDETLELVKEPHGVFANVDTTTPSGLKRGTNLGLVQSKMVNVIFTPYVHEASILFDKNHRARFFTILRDPVDRIVSLFYYKRIATWAPNYNPSVKDQTLEEFIKSSGENWMVRMLSGVMSGPLNVGHLNIAKEILRRKFLIGLLEEKTESFRRFEEYFGWQFPSPVSQTCKNNMYYFEWLSRNPHPALTEGDEIVNKIRKLNVWDIALYEYAKQLFREQEVLFWVPEESNV